MTAIGAPVAPSNPLPLATIPQTLGAIDRHFPASNWIGRHERVAHQLRVPALRRRKEHGGGAVE